MKKPKNSSARKNRQKGNGQARAKTGQNLRPEGSGHSSMPREAAASHAPARHKSARDEEERKRKLWERKQAELEARRTAAQSRQAEEDAVRQRKTRIMYSITCTLLVGLLGAIGWHFA